MTVAFAEDPEIITELDGQFILDLDGFDGPIDLLLQLARDKKIDLTQLSITDLADQYIAFIDRARHLRLEIAADYLVMAAWLAYLKSRLLLPHNDDVDNSEPTPEELAEALAFQLKRLEAMQRAGQKLMALPRLGSSLLARGQPEKFVPVGVTPVKFTLFELLDAYSASQRRTTEPQHYEIAPLNLDSIESALERLTGILGKLPDWSILSNFLPQEDMPPLRRRASVAATFGATLELVKRGDLFLRQSAPFEPIYIKGTAE
jgi:segregation and condensation protein A